tara:strand:+ start:97 stop:387 length:291 start_codon:yes stop_codon:yes gene_type:complete
MYILDFVGYFVFQILQLFKYAVIIYVIMNMLISFNVINNSNKFIYIILEFLYKLTEPGLNLIRKFIPNFGSLDVSPIILILIIEALQYVMTKYGFF